MAQILSYVRVSSTDQNPARQVEEAFTDHLSGASRAERAVLASLLCHA